MKRALTICFLFLATSASASFQSLEPVFPMSGKTGIDFSNVWKPQAAARPSFGVDAQGRVTAITNAIGKVTSFTFDDAGNLTDREDAKAQRTEYGYDSLNRLVSITNEGVWKATFDHDPNGNIVEHASPPATVTFGYNEMNQLTNSSISVNSCQFVIQNSFDLNGNRTNIVYPGGLTVSYHYGPDNRLENVIANHANSTNQFEFSYDGASRLTGIAYPNGVNSTFGLDAEGRVTSIEHGSFIDRTIERNVLGFKKTESIDAGIQPTVPTTQRSIKTHNDADQLTFERVQTSVTNWTEIDYLYNDNGGLDTVMPANEASTSYTYDYDNRLESVGSMTSSTEYLYDASGARIARIAGVSPALSTNYFVVDYVDGLKRPLAETDAAGNITRYYVWSGASLLCHIEADGTTRYYHADELGSTLALTDESGNVTDEFAYMPYGYATHSGTNSTPFQWLGGYGVYYDADTDLHLTLHRAYSSKLKRFISPDPLGIDGFANMYAYGDLNPAYFVDPMGLAVLLEAHPVIKFTVPSGSPMSFSFQPPTQVSINHSKITIIPENQDAYRNHPHFENKLSDGRRFATLGAGPANGIPSFGAVLDSNPNRKKDRNRNRNVFSTPVSFPNGVTEDQYIQTLFNADRAYSDNESYYLFPKNDPGYNSNSYASGLLNATGGTVGQRPPNAPGYGKPLPFRNFSSGRSTGNFGPRIGK